MSLNNLRLLFFITALTCCSYSSNVFGQEKDAITDFYEYANREWMDHTTIPENASVVNNWGILWDEIIDKSIEILSGEVQYDLDENHQYILAQLQNFYTSTAEYSTNERKRVRLVQQHYPLIFGVIFSKITIPDDKEEKINDIINYVTIAYREKIKNSAKIGESNKDFFLSRLDDMRFVIGAPDISDIPVMPSLSAHSLEANIKLSEAYQLSIYSDKPYWEAPPFETDCRYNFNENSVKLFAGTLYATDFINEDDVANLFATLGRTIAHEMTHAFDPYKKKFNKREWKYMTNSLIQQFSQYEIQDGYVVDGKKTLQENFADLSGVEVSLLALKLFVKDNYPDYSDEENSAAMKNYFISFAQFWKEKATAEFELSTLKRIHTPQKFRAIGPLYNQNDFYEVFEIDTTSTYYIPEEKRIRIW